jgi:hypothetical protein
MKMHLCRSSVALLFLTAASISATAASEIEAFGPAEPVTLTDAQRAKILRAIVSGHSVNTPGGKERVIGEPNKPAATIQSLPAPSHGELSVGGAVPETLPLTPLPDSVAVEVPAVRHLSYALINGRLFLIDPATSIVLSDISQ